MDGIMSPLSFDENGSPVHAEYDIVNFARTGFIQVTKKTIFFFILFINSLKATCIFVSMPAIHCLCSKRANHAIAVSFSDIVTSLIKLDETITTPGKNQV